MTSKNQGIIKVLIKIIKFCSPFKTEILCVKNHSISSIFSLFSRRVKAKVFVDLTLYMQMYHLYIKQTIKLLEIVIEYNIPDLPSLYLHCNYIISIKNKASLDFQSWRNVFSDVWLTISLEFVFWRMRGRVGGPNNANVESRVLMYPLDTGHGVFNPEI